MISVFGSSGVAILSFFLFLATTSDFCETRTNKTVQPIPVSLMGRTPAFEIVGGNEFQTLREGQGGWEIRSPYFDEGCNHVDNLFWEWRFIVSVIGFH